MNRKNDSNDDESTTSGKSLLGEFLKKAVSTGMEAVFLTEEVIKTTLQESSLGKEAGPWLQQLHGLRRDIFQLVTQEVAQQLKKIDVTKELSRVLEFYDIEVSAKIKFTPRKEDSSKPPIT